jgi:hypothetical protein
LGSEWEASTNDLEKKEIVDMGFLLTARLMGELRGAEIMKDAIVIALLGCL